MFFAGSSKTGPEDADGSGVAHRREETVLETCRKTRPVPLAIRKYGYESPGRCDRALLMREWEESTHIWRRGAGWS